MTKDVPFERMSIEERRAVLMTLARTLQISALMAERDGHPISKMMRQLGDRLEECRETVAADKDGGKFVIHKAIQLLSEFEMQRPRGSVH